MGKTTKNKKNKEMVVKEGNSFALLPDYIRKSAGRGMEGVSREDLVLPRIKLLQVLSPEFSEGKGKPGEMVNSLTGENYGTEMIFIPVLHYKNRFLFGERTPGAQILCGSDDGILPNTQYGPVKSKECVECPLQGWTEGKKGEPQRPECALFYNFVILKDGKTPIGLSLGSSKIKVAKKLLSTVRYLGPNLDLFSLKFVLKTRLEKTGKGEFFNFVIDPRGFASKEEFAFAAEVYASLSKVKVSIEREVPGENEVEGA